MRVLVTGGGGREHAVLWKLSQSPRVSRLYCAPGNGGIAEIAECVPIRATDVEALTAFAAREGIGLCAVTSDDPQAAGLVDAMRQAGIAAFGCTQAAARIESSKIFAKDLMRKYGIPTARYESFDRLEDALACIQTRPAPMVVKADGLALGKGAVVARTREDAEWAARDMMEHGRFGGAGRRVVIEDYMEGREVTVMVFTDGSAFAEMPPCRDHKRIGDGDTGPNTGGMGAFSPVPDYTPEIAARARREIFEPTLAAMRADGCPFTGVLYFEMMLTADGPKIIEYNARFGDPEAQVVLPLLETDLLDIFEAVAGGRLDPESVRFRDKACAIVVAASRGYPGAPDTGHEIEGLDALSGDVLAFHAGTKRRSDGGGRRYENSGGRVLGVCAAGDTLPDALERVYANIHKIRFEGIHFRNDIGRRDTR
ncbi:MAG: phosphoribosylamine--glycine ligase [Oscillospiraceae bacterium]|nr:phosphoribosylamine--glycine ligase [Oscillospiraceae bacterium]